MMSQSPFPLAWIGSDLHEFRSADSTYCRYLYSTLPRFPKEHFDGKHSLLRQQKHDLKDARIWRKFNQNWTSESQKTHEEITRRASEVGVTIPTEFSSFLYDEALVSKLRSPTDCYFRLSASLIESRGPQEGYFIHFYSDSQNCYEWYLFLDKKDQHAVVASTEYLASPELTDEFWENERHQIVCCAYSIEEFVYRLWIENECWMRISEKTHDLTEEMKQYLESSKTTEELDV